MKIMPVNGRKVVMQKVIRAKGLVDVVIEKMIQDPIVIIDGDKITAAGTQPLSVDIPGMFI
jgi:hypothetical protein